MRIARNTCLVARRAIFLGLVVVLAAGAALAEDWQWAPVTGPLPARLTGSACQTAPLTCANPFLRAVCDQLYPVPWAPGEAVLLRPTGNTTACGFWTGPREYLLLVKQGGHWRRVSPSGAVPVKEPQLAYFGHDAGDHAWSQPARVLVVGAAPGQGVTISRVPLFEAGCTLMTLERAERELRQARDFLGWMKPAPADLTQRVAALQARMDATRAQLAEQTSGLLDSYQALPAPRYALENLAFFSRLYNRSKGFDKIGQPGVWEQHFYGRPEFTEAVALRQAAQEALWAQRPQTLAAETAQVFGPGATFGAAITHGLVKFRRDRPFPEPLQTSLRLTLAGDEFESFQVALAALDRPLQDATVTVTWEGPGPHPEVLLRPVGYVETKPDPANLTEYTGWWPDPLMPPGPVQVAAHETQPVWGTVHATKDTRRGEHSAVVTVSAAGQPPLRLQLTARVLRPNLGFTHLPSLLSLRLQSIKAFYKLDTLSQDVKRRWYAFCLQYRMNPNDIYSAESVPEEEDLDFCIERGFNALVMTTPPLRRTTRNSTENLQVWISDDNVTFRPAPAGYRVTHDADASIIIEGLDVTARYVKAHSTLTDQDYTFSLKALERDRITAYDGDQAFTGPAAYVGTEDGTKPLKSFDARWGAALDYQQSSLGVDLGEPRHVTKLVLHSQTRGLLERVKRFHDMAQAHGMGDRAYVYGFDEWRDVKRYGDIRDTYDQLKAAAPGIKASSTLVHPVPPIDRTIDAFCPALCYEFPEYEPVRARGQEVWTYEGGCPYDPYPTHELLDVPAVEARAFFWVIWRYQYTGWLHWELNVWSGNTSGDKRWPEVPWNPARSGVRNGEVGRIYPGPDATPLPSVRLENMRDGIEDYDILWLLRDRARKLPAADSRRAAAEKLISAATATLCQSRAHFERDPAKVLATHERLLLALDALSR